MDHEETTIRPYRPGDLDDLYRICLLTANSGQDATPLYQDPQMPGHIYAAPYGLFEPSLAFVVEDTDGVGGYILAALDTQAFAKRLESEWWPQLRSRYPEPLPASPQEPWTPDQRAAYVIHHPWPTPVELTQRYPSHMHIDLLPRLQGRGLGRRLIDTVTGALREQGSPGLHLHVNLANQRAAEFYRHVGFTELPITGARLFVMDLRTTS
jgi:ribosomal protein S18 acetylase RimI-like enzyme